VAPSSSDKTRFMRAALRLARRGAGTVSPNPLVGAILVRGGKIVGSGYHRFFGGPHAECNALEIAGEKARGADLYINLEPCSHFGKTPPCSDALIAAGIRRAFIGMQDPNPLVSGSGIKKLAAAGIAVETGDETVDSAKTFSLESLSFIKNKVVVSPKRINRRIDKMRFFIPKFSIYFLLRKNLLYP